MWRSDHTPKVTDVTIRTIQSSEAGLPPAILATVKKPLLPPPPSEAFVEDFESLAVNKEEPSHQAQAQSLLRPLTPLAPLATNSDNPLLSAASAQGVSHLEQWEDVRSSQPSSTGLLVVSPSAEYLAETADGKVSSEEPPRKRPKLRLQEPYIFNQGKTVLTQCNTTIENAPPSYSSLSAISAEKETQSSCLDPCCSNSHNYFPTYHSNGISYEDSLLGNQAWQVDNNLFENFFHQEFDFVCNALTNAEERDAARIGFSKGDNSPTIDSLKQKKFLLYIDRDNINAQIKALPRVPDGDQVDPNAVERQRLDAALTRCNAEIVSADELISNHKKVITTQQDTLLLPTFGAENDVDNQKLRLQVPLFDPMLNNPTIDDFWKKLIDYGEGLEWSEAAFKKALSNLLQHEAYKLYYIMRTKPLKDILTALQGSYYNYETVLDLQKKLDSVSRQPNQSITNFMNNVHSL